MRVTVELVGHKYRRYHDAVIELNEATTIGRLESEISAVFGIEPKWQNLFDGKMNRIFGLGSKELSEVGINDGDLVVLKHDRLPHFEALISIIEFCEDLEDSNQREMHLKLANDFVEVLINSNFFVTYTQLNDYYKRIRRTLFRLDRKTPIAIQNTVEEFFRENYKGKNPNFHFNKKIEGLNDGVICTIKLQETIEKHYVKTFYNAEPAESSRFELDITELFVYRILESLGVGATVHFPISVTDSRWLVCIASSEIPRFSTFDEIELNEKSFDKYVRPAIQILTLFFVLNIYDRHSKNVGVDNDGSPYIIDFSVDRSRTRVRDLNNDFYTEVRGTDKINERIGELTFEKRVEIGVEFLKQIEFEKNFDHAVESFMEKEKDAFANKKLYSKTEDVNQYIEVVRRNLSKFVSNCK